jgi:hypothetical protein
MMMMDLVIRSPSVVHWHEEEEKVGEEELVGQLAVLILYWYGDVVIKSLSATRLSTSGNIILSISPLRTVE